MYAAGGVRGVLRSSEPKSKVYDLSDNNRADRGSSLGKDGEYGVGSPPMDLDIIGTRGVGGAETDDDMIGR